MDQLAYSDELFGCGFWPGSGNILEPAFYAYAWPEPEAYSTAIVGPREAFYNASTKGVESGVRRPATPERVWARVGISVATFLGETKEK
jgi:hypothetical protein